MSYIEKHMRTSLENHFLEQILDTEKFKAFYMRAEPNSRMMSTLFIFHPEGITIAGDLTPALHGNCSVLGYGLDWFAGKNSEGYLCEKFLQKAWHSDLAEDELNAMSEAVRRGRHDFEPWLGLDDIRNDREALIDDLLELRGDLVKADAQEERDACRKAIRDMKPALIKAREEFIDRRKQVTEKLAKLAYDMSSLGEHGLYEEWIEHFEGDTEGMPGYGYSPRESGWLCALQQKFSELYHKMKGTSANE